METKNEVKAYENIEILPTSVVEAQSRAEIDIQVTTAKRYPRNLTRSQEQAIAQVSTKEIAESCLYVLPRGGNSITGPSVHLARIIASSYKNLRIDSKIVDIGDTMLTAQSVCIDLENNYAVRTETKRRITNRQGQRFNDDMIVVTANAALSIASRNAILQVIPVSFSNSVIRAVKNVLGGDLSTKEKLIAKRTHIINQFADNYKVSEEKVLEMMGVSGVNNLDEEKLVDLIGVAQAIKDGDTSIAEIFGTKDNKSEETRKKAKDIIKKSKEKQDGTGSKS